MASATAALTSSRPGASLELNRQFAVGIAIAMFIVNFAGFGPTFFLRPFFDVPQIPFYLYLHGVVGTAWFALVVIQAVLIANRQFTRHRQLGWFGVGLGASFSALEVVPLAYLGFEAYHTYKLSHATSWMTRYHWPIMFFLAVAFWNLVGAGLFGFLINPPLSLYYMQGLNLTPLHGHTALFGVYGMLGIGLVLFCLRGLRPTIVWDERLLRTSFWALNIGLALMALITLLPLGTMQLFAAIEQGYWYARSEQFMQRPIVELLVWMRVPGDIVFSLGAAAFTWFVIKLWWVPWRTEPLPAGSGLVKR